jgi:hypothetical protein
MSQRPLADPALPGDPRQRHAVLKVRCEQPPAGHRLLPLALRQPGQASGKSVRVTGHLSTVSQMVIVCPLFRNLGSGTAASKINASGA